MNSLPYGKSHMILQVSSSVFVQIFLSKECSETLGTVLEKYSIMYILYLIKAQKTFSG